MRAIALAEAKGYEVRWSRITWQDHGGKATVALHLAPAPEKGTSNARQYSHQAVGKTARRNIENLVAYVEGLSDVVQPADGPVDPTGGDAGVHDGTPECPGEGGPRPA